MEFYTHPTPIPPLYHSIFKEMPGVLKCGRRLFFMGKDHPGIDIWQTFGYSGNIRFWEETLRTHETSLFPC